jgi:hypothetical protein
MRKVEDEGIGSWEGRRLEVGSGKLGRWEAGKLGRWEAGKVGSGKAERE